MISISQEELLALLSDGRIVSGETSLVVGQDGYAAVHHEGKIKCFLPDLERVFSIYRESAQQSVHADAEIEKQAEVLFQEIANAKVGTIPDEVVSEWKKLGELLYNVPHTQHDAQQKRIETELSEWGNPSRDTTRR